MKTITFRLTDKQAHYLELIAEENLRTVEHIVWNALDWGITALSSEELSMHIEKLPEDWIEEDRERFFNTESHCHEFPHFCGYKDSLIVASFRGNILLDLKGKLIDLDQETNVSDQLDLAQQMESEYQTALSESKASKRIN